MLGQPQMLGLWMDHNNLQIVWHCGHKVEHNLIGSKVGHNNHNNCLDTNNNLKYNLEINGVLWGSPNGVGT
jgi:hypothetical protein